VLPARGGRDVFPAYANISKRNLDTSELVPRFLFFMKANLYNSLYYKELR
jgi:hypothetical protein